MSRLLYHKDFFSVYMRSSGLLGYVKPAGDRMIQTLALLGIVWALASCVGAPGAEGALSIEDAIEASADRITRDISPGSRVAIVAFESEHDNLSDYIMEELTGALFDRNIEVADRQNLEYVYRELGFHGTGAVSEESAQSIGKFLGAELVITGQLTHLGGTYRYRTNAIHVEQATRASVTRLTVRGDTPMQRMIAALSSQKTAVKTAKYGVNEQTQPASPGTFLDRGILFATRSEWEAAITDFTEALNLDPNLTAAYLLRGRALYASVSKVTGIGDNFSSVSTVSYTGMVVTEDKGRIYDRAIADFTQAIRLDPKFTTAYIERGIAYDDKGEYDRAIADFTQAIRLDPKFTTAYIERGNAYADKGEYDRAIADYTQAIKLDPKYVRAYSNRGTVYADKGEPDRAIADYNQAIKLDPKYVRAYSNRGTVYADKGEPDRAIADYTQAIKLDPKYAPAYNNRGTAYIDKKDYDRAIADYTQAIKLDPNYALAYSNRGIAYDGKGDYDRAIVDYTQAIKLDPNDAATYANRGIAYNAKGQRNQAIQDLERAAALDPNNQKIKDLLREIRGR